MPAPTSHPTASLLGDAENKSPFPSLFSWFPTLAHHLCLLGPTPLTSPGAPTRNVHHPWACLCDEKGEMSVSSLSLGAVIPDSVHYLFPSNLISI